MTANINALADQVAGSIKAYIGDRFKTFEAGMRQFVKAAVDELPRAKDGATGSKGDQGAPGLDGKNGRDGVDGKDGAVGEQGRAGPAGPAGAPGLDGKAGPPGPDGKDGAPGQRGADGTHGKDADADVIAQRAIGIVVKFLDEIPVPKDGRDGKDGPEGKPGAAGADGKDFDPTILRAEVVLAVKSAVAEIPPPLPGKDADASAIADVVYERLMRSIRMPEDGKSVTIEDIQPAIESEVERWELDFERRANEQLAQAIARIPIPRDGRDGFSLDDLDIEAKAGGRTILLKLKSDDREIVREVRLGVPLDRGVFKSGAAYEAGDGVTYGGSFWLAQKDTASTPGNGADWRLSVKRGRDAKPETAE